MRRQQESFAQRAPHSLPTAPLASASDAVGCCGFNAKPESGDIFLAAFEGRALRARRRARRRRRLFVGFGLGRQCLGWLQGWEEQKQRRPVGTLSLNVTCF